MNSIQIIGRIVRDPEVRYTTGGKDGQQMAIARTSIAVDRERTGADGQKETDFINITAFGQQGTFAEKYLHQGMQIALEGRLQTGSYTNKEGQKVYTAEVVVRRFEFVESKSNNTAAQGGGQAPVQQAGGNNPAPNDDFMNIPDGIDESIDEMPWMN